MEKILTPNNARFTYYPIKYKRLHDLYSVAKKLYWVPEEIKDLKSDRIEWNEKLNEHERNFIKNILGFFAASDGIVNENLATMFYNDVQIAEARAFYAAQINIEQIHSEMYSLMIDTFITDTNEKNDLFNAIETNPSVKKKADWALKWINNTDVFAERLVAFAIVEGVFFSASFCAIFWMMGKGLLRNGLGKSNEFIARDEGLHCVFAVELYRLLENKLDTTRIHQIFREAVTVETEFVRDSLKVDLIGMNSNKMIQYVQFIADFWLKVLGYETLYNVANPFDFMENLSLGGATNFFEADTTDYQLANSETNKSSDFSLGNDEDF